MDGDIVAGDDVLRRHIEGDDAQADADETVNGPEDEDQAGPLGHRQEAPEAEDDGALVLVEHLDALEDVHHREDDDDDDGRKLVWHGKPLLKGWLLSVS